MINKKRALNEPEMFINFYKKPFFNKTLSAENLISSSLSSCFVAIYKSDFSSSRVVLSRILSNKTIFCNETILKQF